MLKLKELSEIESASPNIAEDGRMILDVEEEQEDDESEDEGEWSDHHNGGTNHPNHFE